MTREKHETAARDSASYAHGTLATFPGPGRRPDSVGALPARASLGLWKHAAALPAGFAADLQRWRKRRMGRRLPAIALCDGLPRQRGHHSDLRALRAAE